MDADLLDACEAAEATPAAAHLPTVTAERPRSCGVPNGARPGPRDMLDDIGIESRDMPGGSAAVRTPSRGIPSASGRVSDLRAQDTPVAGASPSAGSRDTSIAGAFTTPGARDTPATGSGSRGTPASSRRRPTDGSRASGRRSTGSAVKRRFPGPAGILPVTVSEHMGSGDMRLGESWYGEMLDSYS